MVPFEEPHPPRAPRSLDEEILEAETSAILSQLTDEQRQAVLARDYNRLLDLGGNIYFLAKVFSTDGQSFVQAVSTMTGVSVEGYQAMMNAGGRSPEGVRSLKDTAGKDNN